MNSRFYRALNRETCCPAVEAVELLASRPRDARAVLPPRRSNGGAIHRFRDPNGCAAPFIRPLRQPRKSLLAARSSLLVATRTRYLSESSRPCASSRQSLGVADYTAQTRDADRGIC